MAKWDILKSAVTQIIKPNDNQEITGEKLQAVLLSIIASLGENATFVGIASPSLKPGYFDGPVFYLAFTPGAYSNFGGVVIKSGEVASLKKDGPNSEWTYEVAKLTVSEDIADKAYVDNKIAALVAGAPETLDTLKELADALKNNADIIDVLNLAISQKADKAYVTALESIISQKADKAYVTVLENTITELSLKVQNLRSEVEALKNSSGGSGTTPPDEKPEDEPIIDLGGAFVSDNAEIIDLGGAFVSDDAEIIDLGGA